MTTEEFQKLILEKMESMEKRLGNIEQNMATKEDVARLERLANGSMEIIEQTYREVENIGRAQIVQGESINILALRQLQAEAELATLKKAR